MLFRNNLKNSYPPIEVHVTRGNLTESVHIVDAVVLDVDGGTVASFGAGETSLTYPRSAIKMLQAIHFVESGAYTEYGFTESHLSLACASHNGEGPHTDLVLNWLDRIGCVEDDLVCGPHYPYDEKTSRELIRHDLPPKKRHNNCSGKHSSMLSSLRKLRIPHQHYGAYDHELQMDLRKVLSEVSSDDMDQAPWGIDGCGIPTYAMSLKGMAQGMGCLLKEKVLHAERKEACRLIREAVLSQPYYIGGTGDFCSEAMALTNGRLLMKTGAEGVYAGAILEEGLSFGMKVRDGNPRASRVAAGALLKAFQGLTEAEFLRLSSHTQPEVKSWSGETVGKIFVPHLLIS